MAVSVRYVFYTLNYVTNIVIFKFEGYIFPNDILKPSVKLNCLIFFCNVVFYCVRLKWRKKCNYFYNLTCFEKYEFLFKALYLSGFLSLQLQRQLHQVQNINRFTDSVKITSRILYNINCVISPIPIYIIFYYIIHVL
jgi:hypothetical protein